MNNIIQSPTDLDSARSLIINSGLYRHHTLRKSLHKAFSLTNNNSVLKSLKTSHWEVLYHLIENHILNRVVTISDIPHGIGLPASTARRLMRHLEHIGLIITIRDDQDMRRFKTKLVDKYLLIVDDFVADYVDGYAGIIKRHDKKERYIALESLSRSREELLQSEAQLLNAQKLSSMGHWVWDDKISQYRTFSKEAAQIFGKPIEYFLNRTYENDIDDEFIHPDDLGLFRSVMYESEEKLINYNLQYRIIRPDGEIRYIHEVSELILDKHGVIDLQIGTTQDITEIIELRKRAEAIDT